MDWLLKNTGLVLMLVFVVISIVRSIAQARKTGAEHEAGHDETEEERRVREIQERIRRKIAERRGEFAPDSSAPPLLAPEPQESRPVFRPAPAIPELEPFGGPLKRAFVGLERRVQPATAAPMVLESQGAEIERQTRLAGEMKALEEARPVVQRRPAHAAEIREDVAHSEPAMRTVARARLLEDLSDPQSLRRAFLLREVLGTPVGLR